MRRQTRLQGGQEKWPIPYSVAVTDITFPGSSRRSQRTLIDALPRLVGIQYATGEEQINGSRRNEEIEPKQKQHPVVDVSGDEMKSNAVKNNIS